MMNNMLFINLRKEGRSFFEAVSKANETVYLILLTLYETIYFMLKFGWAEEAGDIVGYIRYSLLAVVMWGSALYLFFVIASWKKLWNKNLALIAVGGVILWATWLFSKKMTTNLYGVVMDAFFCLMACGKDYRKMLRCLLCVAVVMLVLAGIGMPLGYTLDLAKPDNPHPGHSLGINYPNNWGYLVFLGMMIFWYLYLRFRPLVTFTFFWGISVFMYFYICCRTISLLGIAFPVMALVVDRIEKYADRAERRGEEEKKRGKFSPGDFMTGLITAMPFGAFAFMMFLSKQYEWLHKHFYRGWFKNLAMRFVQGGLYFRTYGLPLVGNPYRANQFTYVNVNGQFEKVGILDSSFAAYIIMRGIIWLMYTLTWLSAAIWKALKNRDYAIPFLEMIILVFAMIERPGLEMWYNFVMLYPLAKVAGAAAQTENGSKTAGEPEESEEPEEHEKALN